jgi:hypothetical protein
VLRNFLTPEYHVWCSVAKRVQQSKKPRIQSPRCPLIESRPEVELEPTLNPGRLIDSRCESELRIRAVGL